jgi:hypothetical protein
LVGADTAARLAACFGESFSKPIAVIASVSDQGGGWRQIGKDQPRTLMIAHLALADHEHEGRAAAIADRVELGIQAAFGAPDAAGNRPFLRRLAAVR